MESQTAGRGLAGSLRASLASMAELAAVSAGSENVPPVSLLGDSRKRPRSEDGSGVRGGGGGRGGGLAADGDGEGEGEDEPDGRMEHKAGQQQQQHQQQQHQQQYQHQHQHYRQDGLFSPAQLVVKRQRLDSSALNLVKRERLAPAGGEAQAQRQVRPDGSPVNLVKRESSIALRCQVEQRNDSGEANSCIQKFAIVPASVTVAGLLQFVLQSLDIKANCADCIASIQLPNWKALSLNEVCDNPEQMQAVSLLSQISNIAVFKIELPVPDTPAALPSAMIRNLLKSLIPPQAGNAAMHVAWFKQAGCPLPDSTVEDFLQSPDSYEFGSSDRRAFSDWHSRMCLQYLEQVSKGTGLYLPLPLLPMLGDNRAAAPAAAAAAAGAGAADDDALAEQQNVALFSQQQQPQQQPQQRDSRSNKVRASFDPESELPLLQQWFAANSHPSRELMEQYRQLLNQLPSRIGRRQLDLANIVYWFKNMRASERRVSGQVPVAKSEEEAGSSEVEQDEEASGVGSGDLGGGCDELRAGGKENSELLGLPPAWQQQQQQQQQQHSLLRSPASSYCGDTPGQRLEAENSDAAAAAGGTNAGDISASAKRRRTRVFIDPVTEIPQLESWFAAESHPTSAQFHLYASILNSMPFRQKQPSLEAKNIQLWFKNHRAKVKRERLDLSTDATNPEASGNCDTGLSLPVSPGSSEATDTAAAPATAAEMPAVVPIPEQAAMPEQSSAPEQSAIPEQSAMPGT